MTGAAGGYVTVIFDRLRHPQFCHPGELVPQLTGAAGGYVTVIFDRLTRKEVYDRKRHPSR